MVLLERQGLLDQQERLVPAGATGATGRYWCDRSDWCCTGATGATGPAGATGATGGAPGINAYSTTPQFYATRSWLQYRCSNSKRLLAPGGAICLHSLRGLLSSRKRQRPHLSISITSATAATFLSVQLSQRPRCLQQVLQERQERQVLLVRQERQVLLGRQVRQGRKERQVLLGLLVRQERQEAPGINAYSTTQQFTQPAVGSNIAVQIPSGYWLQVGQYVYIASGGYYQVASGSVPNFLSR